MTDKELIAKFKKAHDAIEWIEPPTPPPPGQFIWCNGVNIHLPLPRAELMERIKEANKIRWPRQQT